MTVNVTIAPRIRTTACACFINSARRAAPRVIAGALTGTAYGPTTAAVQTSGCMQGCDKSSAEDEGGCSARNQQAADDFVYGKTFSEKDPGKENNQHHAELVDGRDGRRRAKLQRAEVAKPRQS